MAVPSMYNRVIVLQQPHQESDARLAYIANRLCFGDASLLYERQKTFMQGRRSKKAEISSAENLEAVSGAHQLEVRGTTAIKTPVCRHMCKLCDGISYHTSHADAVYLGWRDRTKCMHLCLESTRTCVQRVGESNQFAALVGLAGNAHVLTSRTATSTFQPTRSYDHMQSCA